MRFIHTADWHIGNAMHDINRNEEHGRFFHWLKETIVECGAEALIVAGDIFDNRTPSNEAKKLYYRFLASLVDTCCKNVIVVGGNHDSGDLLDTTKELAEALNIHVVGTMNNRSLGEAVFELRGAEDEVSAICAAVPYANEGVLRRFFNEECENKTFSDHAYGKLYEEAYEKADELRAGRPIPIIATGHLFASGLEGRYEGCEDEVEYEDGIKKLDHVGNLGKVHVNVFPEGFGYVALGHIHYSTKVAGKDQILYSGSPFVMGFDDATLPHYVLQVDIDEKAAKPVKIEVPQKDVYKRLSTEKEDVIEKIKELAKAHTNPEENVYIEVCYFPQEKQALEKAVEELKLPDRIRVVNWKRVGVSDHKGLETDLDISEMADIQFDDVVRSWLLSQNPIKDKDKKSAEQIQKEEKELFEAFIKYFRAAKEQVELGG